MFKFVTHLVFTFWFLTAISAAPRGAFAAGAAATLEPIEVKASRTKLPADALPGSVTVITREQIERSKFMQVKDLLRQTMGVDMVQNGPMGSTANMFIRGTGSSSTLVMIDNVQINANTTGAMDFRDINLDNVERIEILRGPQSTLWGGWALGGVVNIITKKGKGEPAHFVSFEGGSFATFKETVGSSGAADKVDYSMTASRTDTAGFSAANARNGNNEEDGYHADNFSARAGYNFLKDGRAEIIGRYTRSTSDFDGFSFTTGKPVDGPHFNKNDSFYLAAPIQKGVTDWWDAKLNLGMAYDNLRSYDPSSTTAYLFNRTYTADFQNNLTLNDYFSTVLGMQYQALNGENEQQSLRRDIFQQGYYLQNQFNYQNELVLTAGFRHDVNSVYEDKTTYKVEGGYRFKQLGTLLKVSHATGFRAPSINDLFFPNFSNPNLKPEESRNWEGGFEQTLLAGALKFGVTYFSSDLTNLIQFDSTTFRPENVGKATSRGTESFIDYLFTQNLGLMLNHTWNEAVDGNGAPLRRRAKNKFNATIHHRLDDKLDYLVSLYARSDIRDGNFNAGGYVTLRAAVSYKLTKSLKLFVRGENLLDQKYEEIPNFGTAGVSGFGGFTYSF